MSKYIEGLQFFLCVNAQSHNLNKRLLGCFIFYVMTLISRGHSDSCLYTVHYVEEHFFVSVPW